MDVTGLPAPARDGRWYAGLAGVIAIVAVEVDLWHRATVGRSAHRSFSGYVQPGSGIFPNTWPLLPIGIVAGSVVLALLIRWLLPPNSRARAVAPGLVL